VVPAGDARLEVRRLHDEEIAGQLVEHVVGRVAEEQTLEAAA
jgi:hypothetical protein